MKAEAIRQSFLNYFSSKDHEVLHSSPLVPQGDATLLFTNAGMVQFKDTFVGKETRPYKRAVTSQKCVRAGGKHNDLDEVGKTSRHHTFFEMLGNFSFGDYFKKDAIAWAWGFLVDELKIDPKRLICTVHRGDKNLGIGLDEEAKELWKKQTGFGDDRILALGSKENFWMMGDTGPMGPCSEIHYYSGKGEPKLPPADENHPDWAPWLEIWNLVFMQYERKTKGGELFSLPAPSIDTGAGLERVASVMQQVESNYDTDLFTHLISKTSGIANVDYGKNSENDTSIRVIADHARASAFLITDGVFPDKTNREYVLRRIFRRAVRHGKRLGIEKPFMHLVCNQVVESMKNAFPELAERKAIIENVCLEEEKLFRRTIDRGLALLEDEFTQAKSNVVSGEKVFKLYDTYGFPDDLTEIIALERSFAIDRDGFNNELEKAKERSRGVVQSQSEDSGSLKTFANQHPKTAFEGYDSLTTDRAKVLGILCGGKEVNQANTGDEVYVVFDKTVFYGESGGQVGDTGLGKNATTTCTITDTTKPNGTTHVHSLNITKGTLKTGDFFELEVSSKRRRCIQANHSATHLLHYALKNRLGDHVAQKGSLVTPEKLRFDFSHFNPMSREEIKDVETWVNTQTLSNDTSVIEELSLADAKKKGAVAMFGEKYGDMVRVVQMGEKSLEFCGGTHVSHTGEVGLFKIISETGVAQGVRRIEAVTAAYALDHVQAQQSVIETTCETLRCNPADLQSKLEKLLAAQKNLEKENQRLKNKVATGGDQDVMQNIKEISGIPVLATQLDVDDAKTLRDTGDKLRDKLKKGVVVLLGASENKAFVVALVDKTLTPKIHAGKIVSKVAGHLGGKGGGRPDMAQGGGPHKDLMPSALQVALDVVSEMAT